ncbi:hypothetical protein ILFOPFJJ_03556 [Ensifer psoraleae]|nr:hypothetical protein [Sinorhizobium psoraleae]
MSAMFAKTAAIAHDFEGRYQLPVASAKGDHSAKS